MFCGFRLINLNFPSLSCRSCVWWGPSHGFILDALPLVGFCFMFFSKVVSKTENIKALIMQNFCLHLVSCSPVWMFQCAFFQQYDLVNSWSTGNPLQVTGHPHGGLSWASCCSLYNCVTKHSSLDIVSCVYFWIASIHLNILSPILNLKPVFHFTDRLFQLQMVYTFSKDFITVS